MGAALIKAKGRVSSAVNSRLGATANQWPARDCHHHHQRLPIRAIGGEQKRMRKTQPGSSYHLCRAGESGGERETNTGTNRRREQNCDDMVQTLEIYRLVV